MNPVFQAVYQCPACWTRVTKSSIYVNPDPEYHVHVNGDRFPMEVLSMRQVDFLHHTAIQAGINKGIANLAAVTKTPTMFFTKEAPMATYGDYEQHPWAVTALKTFTDQINQQVTTARDARDPEKIFRALDVQPGDRVRLTHLTFHQYNPSRLPEKDAAVLEGKVESVKQKNGKSKIQIHGFAVAGNNIFWPVANYKVEVLHRVYRWTDRDRVIVEIMGIQPRVWEQYSEEVRASHRQSKKVRVDRIIKLLGANTEVE